MSITKFEIGWTKMVDCLIWHKRFEANMYMYKVPKHTASPETIKQASVTAWERRDKETAVVALSETLYNTPGLSEQEETVLFNAMFSKLLELDDFSCWSVRKIVERNTKIS